MSPAAKRFVSSVKEIAAARQPAVGLSYMASEWLGKIVIVWGLSVKRSVGFSILLGKSRLNKIAARWPTKAVAQFYFIEII